MKGLPRGTFDRLVQAHQADKHAKGFGCWDQLVAMVYAQLSGASSLRVLETGFNSQGTHHTITLGRGRSDAQPWPMRLPGVRRKSLPRPPGC
jgi:hypothetical protein